MPEPHSQLIARLRRSSDPIKVTDLDLLAPHRQMIEVLTDVNNIALDILADNIVRQAPTKIQTVSLANPILHMVNAFRYGILGISDIHIGTAIGFMLLATAALYGFCIHLLKSGRGLRQ